MKNFHFEKYKSVKNNTSFCSDMHMHTRFCDGADTAEDMVLSAIDKGLSVIGFSRHSDPLTELTPFATPENAVAYQAEISMLKEKYKGKIDILCGVEKDYYSSEDVTPYDYVIGSVHYWKCGELFVPVDCDVQNIKVAAEYFGGIYEAIDVYYKTVAQVASLADIVGHFDLVTKFSERERLFDESDPKYVASWKYAADKIIHADKVVEVNTGAVSRGYRNTPYPSKQISDYFAEHGASFILNSDSHKAENIAYAFGKFVDEYRDSLVVPIVT